MKRYIGMDVHAASCTLAVISEQGRRLRDFPVETNGQALIITSVALAAGFLTLLGSAWQTIASFGLFISIAIVIALLATVVLLTAITIRYSEPAGSVRLQTRSEGALCVSALE
jgi:hypothetical protein